MKSGAGVICTLEVNSVSPFEIFLSVPRGFSHSYLFVRSLHLHSCQFLCVSTKKTKWYLWLNNGSSCLAECTFPPSFFQCCITSFSDGTGKIACGKKAAWRWQWRWWRHWSLSLLGLSPPRPIPPSVSLLPQRDVYHAVTQDMHTHLTRPLVRPWAIWSTLMRVSSNVNANSCTGFQIHIQFEFWILAYLRMFAFMKCFFCLFTTGMDNFWPPFFISATKRLNRTTHFLTKCMTKINKYRQNMSS